MLFQVPEAMPVRAVSEAKSQERFREQGFRGGQIRPRQAGADSAPGSPRVRGAARGQAVPEEVGAAGGAGRGGAAGGRAPIGGRVYLARRKPGRRGREAGCAPGRELPPSVIAASQRGRASGPGGPRLPLRKAAPAASSGTRLPTSGARAAERRPGTPRRPSGLGAASARWVIVAGAGGAAGALFPRPGAGTAGTWAGPGSRGCPGQRRRWQAGGSPGPPCEWVGAGAGTRRASRCGPRPGAAAGSREERAA